MSTVLFVLAACQAATAGVGVAAFAFYMVVKARHPLIDPGKAGLAVVTGIFVALVSSGIALRLIGA